jgi:hypothetical protein
MCYTFHIIPVKLSLFFHGVSVKLHIYQMQKIRDRIAVTCHIERYRNQQNAHKIAPAAMIKHRNSAYTGGNYHNENSVPSCQVINENNDKYKHTYIHILEIDFFQHDY